MVKKINHVTFKLNPGNPVNLRIKPLLSIFEKKFKITLMIPIFFKIQH